MLRFDRTDRVISAILEGTVTREDLLPFYESLNAALDEGKPLGVVIDMAGLSDMTGDAIIEDAKRELALLPRLRRIPRVAVISDKQFVAAFVRWTDPLIPTTDMRVFTSSDADAARAWVAQAPKLAEKLKRRDGLREIPTDQADVVAFEIDGPFDGEALDPIIARIDGLVDRGTSFDMLARVRRFEGFDPRLLTRSGLFSMKVNAIRHLDRYAIVTDATWLRTLARAVAEVMPMEVRVFKLEQEPDAWAWLHCRAAREAV